MPPGNKKRILLYAGLPVVIAAAAIAAYSNSFSVPFQFDDMRTVRRNQSIDDLSRPLHVISRNPARPLFYLSLAADYSVGEFDTTSYHVTNLSFHILNCFLLFFIVLRLCPEKTSLMPFAASLFMAVHPLATEGVTYITGRTDLLSSFFMLASFLAFIEFLNSKGAAFYTLSMVFFLMGMGTKESAAVVPLILILYSWIFINGGSLKKLLLDEWKYYVPYFAVLITGLLIRIFYVGGIQETGKSVYIYLINQFKVMVFYMRLAVFPAGQSIDHYIRESDSFLDGAVVLSFMVVAGLILAAVLLRKKSPFLSLGILVFFAGLLPSSSVIPLADLVAEHRMYFSLAGFCIVSAWALSALHGAMGAGLKSGIAVGLVVCLIAASYGVLTYKRNLVWGDDLTLWGDAVSKAPKKGRPYVNLARAYIDEGETDKAVEAYREALKYPDTYKPRVFLGLGLIYLHAERNLDAAQRYFSKALEYKPVIPEALYGMGTVYYQRRNYRRALDFFERAHRKMRKHALLNFLMGDSHYYLGNYDESEVYLKRAAALQPKNYYTHLRLGSIMLMRGEWDEALRRYRTAEKVRPGDPRALEGIRKALEHTTDPGR